MAKLDGIPVVCTLHLSGAEEFVSEGASLDVDHAGAAQFFNVWQNGGQVIFEGPVIFRGQHRNARVSVSVSKYIQTRNGATLRIVGSGEPEFL